MYPLVVVCEFILVPLFLAVEKLGGNSLYAAAVISTAVFVYVLVVTPYKQKLDNARLIVHRVLVLTICAIQIVFSILSIDDATPDIFILWIPLVLLCVLVLGLLVDGVCIIRSSIWWIMQRGVIDLGLKMRKEALIAKPM